VPYQIFRVADGDVAIGVGNDGQWERLCRALAATHLATDERFQGNADRVRNREVLIALLSEHIREMHKGDVVRKLQAAQVPASEVRTVPEVLADPQIAARDMIETIDHPAIGEIRLLGIPYKFAKTKAAVRRHPPLLGEHNEEIRRVYS
jgi:crotonobetainyl-CoA:carnitine CoA-transferase CaiB-like acyl-CoA transferase